MQIDLSKQERVDADPKAIQQVSFTGNLEKDGDTQIFFIIEGAKETVFYFQEEQWKYYKLVLFY